MPLRLTVAGEATCTRFGVYAGVRAYPNARTELRATTHADNCGSVVQTNLEVRRLEDHACRFRERNDLTRHETQLLRVVQHGVHVLNPESVDRAVEEQPLPIRRLQPGEMMFVRPSCGPRMRQRKRQLNSACTPIIVSLHSLVPVSQWCFGHSSRGGGDTQPENTLFTHNALQTRTLPSFFACFSVHVFYVRLHLPHQR